MLIKYDDLPLQQTTEPLAYVATGDRNAYGRYWFNGHDPDGEYYFGIALGIYPNRDVMDCALSIVRRDGTQDSFRASRRCPKDRTDMRIGPFTLEITELMRTLRVTVDDNRTGMTADLRFTAYTPAHEEPPDFLRVGCRVVMHTQRFSQFGQWNGHVTVGGRRQEVRNAYGVRDRSWGWRWVGEPEGGASVPMLRQFFWLWSPIHWADTCTLYGLAEDEQGRRRKQMAQVFPVHAGGETFDPVDGSKILPLGVGSHRLIFENGSRFVSAAEIDLIDGNRIRPLKLEVLLRFHLIGIGYNHPEWGHGMWKGEEVITSEHWKVADLDRLEPKHQHVQQVVRATDGERIGYGVLEQLIVGDYEPYGLVGPVDPPNQSR